MAGHSKRKPNAGLRARWIEAVLHDSKLQPPAVRVAWRLSLDMTDDGRVSVSRAELAESLGVDNPQRVTDRIADLRRAEYLWWDPTSGVGGRKARYQAMIPLPARQWLATRHRIPTPNDRGSGTAEPGTTERGT